MELLILFLGSRFTPLMLLIWSIFGSWGTEFIFRVIDFSESIMAFSPKDSAEYFLYWFGEVILLRNFNGWLRVWFGVVF